MSVGVILLAAGSGHRFGSRKAKQFLLFKNSPLFLHSLRIFDSCSVVSQINLVVPADEKKRIEKLMRTEKLKKPCRVVEGGQYRGQSVRHGLLAFPKAPGVVLIHDAARPNVSSSLIKAVVLAAQRHGVAMAAWPVSDTLKLSDDHLRVRKTVPRKNLWAAQTPQGFRWKIATDCLMTPSPLATDDAELAQRHGYGVKLVKGSPTNMKVTFPIDLKIATALSLL